MRFTNKVVIVTGGSAGIGAAISVLFAKEGANVVIVGRRDNKLEEVYKQCAQFGKKHLIIKADITNDSETKQIIEKTIKQFGKIDVLINNAGVLGNAQKLIEPNILSVYDQVFNTNFRPLVLLMNLAAPYLSKTKGNIVNISSIAGTRGRGGYALYGASKAALNLFSSVAALELASEGIRVNVVSPGPVRTEMAEGIDMSFLTSATIQNRISEPEEIAEMVAFVANEKALSITGSNYFVDCGCLVKR